MRWLPPNSAACNPRQLVRGPHCQASRKSTAATRRLRAAMERENLDALLVCGNQYAGFEGAVLYIPGFEIVHRYVYVRVAALEGEPTLRFPARSPLDRRQDKSPG